MVSLAIRFVVGTNQSLFYVFVGVLIYAVAGGILAIVAEILRGRRMRKEYLERMETQAEERNGNLGPFR